MFVRWGAGHFGHTTIRHHKIGAEVFGPGPELSGNLGTKFKPNHRFSLCLVRIVLGPKCPDFSSIWYRSVLKAKTLRHRCRSVLWPKCPVTVRCPVMLCALKMFCIARTAVLQCCTEPQLIDYSGNRNIDLSIYTELLTVVRVLCSVR